MTLRYLAAVLLLTVIGSGVLGLRQQQLNDKHAIAESHTQMKQDREQIKDLQVRIAERTTREALQQAIERTNLRVDPISQGQDTTPALPPSTTAAATTEPADG